MPASVVLSVSILAVLLLTLGLAITSVAFIQSNTVVRVAIFLSQKKRQYLLIIGDTTTTKDCGVSQTTTKYKFVS